MPILTSEFSRFKDTEPVIKDGKETFGLWNRPPELERKNLNDEQITTIKIDQINQGRPDLISQEYYGTPSLFWVITMFNRPLNTLGWPQAGETIQFPNKDSVMRLL